MLARSVHSLSAVALLMAMVNSAHAEHGFPSQSTLSDMGLSGIEVMSDDDALAIRGLGFDPWRGYGKRSIAIAYGNSYASVAGHGAQAYSKDGFYAKGRYRASGKHGSIAGLIVKYNPKPRRGGKPYGGYGKGGGKKGGGYGKPPRGPRTKKVVVFAGGFSRSSVD